MKRTTGIKAIAIGGAIAVGMMLTGAPAVAQGFGKEVLACVADDEDAVQLGEFPNVMQARRAASARSLGSGTYAIAKVRGRRIAIDGQGMVHPVNEAPCFGSGQRMKPPQEE